MPAAGLDQQIELGTDTARFLLFHPDDLAHRSDDPMDWFDYQFAWSKEAAAGNILGFATGGDGTFLFRVTDGGLTTLEKRGAGACWDFPYRVRHHRVYLDNTNGLPSKEVSDEPTKHPKQWIGIPNGDYRVTVTAIGFDDDVAEGLRRKAPDYVIQFRPVKFLETIPITFGPPALLPDAEPDLVQQAVESKFQTPRIPLKKKYIFLHRPEGFLLPDATGGVSVSRELYEATCGYEDEAGEYHWGRIKDEDFVASPSLDVPSLGFLAWRCGAGCSGRAGEPPSEYGYNLRCKALVRITGRNQLEHWSTVTVKRVTRPKIVIRPEVIEELKNRFALYHATKPRYRNKLQYPSFELERLASRTQPEAIVDWMLGHLKVSDDELVQLMAGPLDQVASRLLEFMDTHLRRKRKK